MTHYHLYLDLNGLHGPVDFAVMQPDGSIRLVPDAALPAGRLVLVPMKEQEE